MSQSSSQQTQIAGKVGFFTRFKVPLFVVGFMFSMTTYLMVYKPYARQVRRRENQQMAEAIFQASQQNGKEEEANFQ
jgi:flagellar biosynthesis/type III secretory pathway M-ring protein FliF/YscJ